MAGELLTMVRRISFLIWMVCVVLVILDGVYWWGWVGANHLNPMWVAFENPYTTYLTLQYEIVATVFLLVGIAYYLNGRKPLLGRKESEQRTASPVR